MRKKVPNRGSELYRASWIRDAESGPHKRKDFEYAIGQRGRVAEIFNRVRPLSLEMIRRLVEQFDLPADVLVKPYALRGELLSA